MPTDRATSLTLVAPAWTRLLGVIGSAAFVAGGYFLISRPTMHGIFALKAVLVGWLCIAFFGTAALLCAIQLVPRFRDRLVIGQDGFSASTSFRLKNHAWADIVGRFAVWQFRRTKLVVFTTSRAKRNLNRALTGHTSSLPAHLGMSAESLAALMNQQLQAARGRPAAPPRRYADTPRAFGRKGVG
jgi:hypothetical protein